MFSTLQHMRGQNNSIFHRTQVLIQNMELYVSVAKSIAEHDKTMQ